MDRLFVDSGALIAYSDGTDGNHVMAKAVFEEVDRKRHPLVTTNYVLNETYTWLQRKPRLGYANALRFGKWFKGISSAAEIREGAPTRSRPPARRLEVRDPRNPFAVIYSSLEIEEEGWRLFVRFAPSGTTYCDCVSFAIMTMLGLKRAFAFDEHFEEAGFERVP